MNKCATLFACQCGMDWKECEYYERRGKNASRCKHKSLVDDECLYEVARAASMLATIGRMGIHLYPVLNEKGERREMPCMYLKGGLGWTKKK